MSVIIRLQNLPWSANALDIRQYFRGLSIPEGGVHIVGGELGDAFIAFSTDEDARQAFNMNGGKIKEVQIKLLLSSRTEMQKVIEAARNPTPFMQVVTPQPLTLPAQLATVIANNVAENKTENKKDDKSIEKRNRHSRSRSRERRDRRDRSRDRSRDRKERRRRDRSRSRERRDRHKRDRSRSRNRSRTHDRSRSRDRDSWRSRDKKSRDLDDKMNGDLSSGSTSNTDINETPSITNLNSVNNWETPALVANKVNDTFGLRNINNVPSLMSSFESNRRSFGAPIVEKETTNNDFRSRDSWPPAHHMFNERFNNVPQSNNRFGNDDKNFNQRGNNLFDNRFNNMNQRDNKNTVRPLLSRPVSMPGPYSPYEGSVDSTSSLGQNDQSNDSFHRDSKSKVRPNCCVRMKIARAGYSDVRRFFHGIFISNNGVKLINDDEGQRTGVCYVRFVHPEGKREALQRNGNTYRGNPVEVFHCDDNEFDNAIDSYVRSTVKDDRPLDRASIYGENIIRNIDEKLSCISIKNLPPFTKEHDVITMVGDFPLVSILMVMNKDSQQLGFLQFVKCEDALRFYNMKDNHFISGKNVTVQLVSENLFFEVKRQHNTNGIVDITDETILPKNSSLSVNTYQSNEISTDCVVLKGLPPKTTDRDIIDFFSDVGLVPNRIHIPLGTNKTNKQSHCYCEFSDSSQAIQALTKNGTHLGMSEVGVDLIQRREMEQLIGLASVASPENNRFNNGTPYGGNTNSPNSGRMVNQNLMPHRQQPNQHIPEAFRNPGCVLSLENVPFRAGVNEILDFFRDFNIPEENVMRRYNDRGHATGDARVAFSSPLEAQRAFSELRHCKIRDRTIFMHLQ